MWRNKHMVWWAVALLIGLSSGCGGDDASSEEAADTSGGGGDAAVSGCPGLLSQCPPGSQPQLGASAAALCGGGPGAEITRGGATVGVCAGDSASCLVVCNFTDPCLCGIDRIDANGVFCVDCVGAAACGNGECEGGESGETCPQDCAPDCEPGVERCVIGDRLVCSANGRWDRVPCRPDQSCEAYSSGVALCQTRISPAGGSIPDVAELPGSADGAPANIRYRNRLLPCPERTAGCQAHGFMFGGEQVLLDHNGQMVLYDVASGELTDTRLRGQPGVVAVGRARVALPGRLPVVHNLRTGTAVEARAFVDGSIPIELGVMTMSADDSRVAASLLLDGTPMSAVWDAETGEVLHLLRFVDPELPSLQPASWIGLGPEGRILVETRYDNRQLTALVVVWNVEEGRLVQLIRPSQSIPVAVVPGRPWVLMTRGMWDLEAGDWLWRLPQGHSFPSGVNSSMRVAISPNGAVIASGSGLVDVESGAVVFRLSGLGGAWFDDSGSLLLLDGSNEFGPPALYSDRLEP